MKTCVWVGVGVWVALVTPGAWAQQAPLPMEPYSLPQGGFRVVSTPKLSLSLHFTDVDAVNLIRQISLAGNLDVVVGQVTGKVAKIDLDNVSPEKALEKVVELAGLDWKLEGKTYLVGAKSPVPTVKPPVFDLVMNDASVLQLLEVMAQQADIQIVVSNEVLDTDKIQYLHLKNVLGGQAIEKIAWAANLICRKKEDYYMISKTEMK